MSAADLLVSVFVASCVVAAYVLGWKQRGQVEAIRRASPLSGRNDPNG
jgi:hypothetical protein